MQTWDRFYEFSLKHKDAFFNKLRAQSLSDDEYHHVQRVWPSFCMLDEARLAPNLCQVDGSLSQSLFCQYCASPANHIILCPSELIGLEITYVSLLSIELGCWS